MENLYYPYMMIDASDGQVRIFCVPDSKETYEEYTYESVSFEACDVDKVYAAFKALVKDLPSVVEALEEEKRAALRTDLQARLLASQLHQRKIEDELAALDQ